jgi:hypothetical protein
MFGWRGAPCFDDGELLQLDNPDNSTSTDTATNRLR